MELQIPELYGYIYRPTMMQRSLPIIGLLLALALCYGIYRLYRWFKARKPYWVVAKEKLIDGCKEFEKGVISAKGFYNLLTDVVKWYCSLRFGLQLDNKTDSEIPEQLSVRAGLPDELVAGLARVMETAYDVKFAGLAVELQQVQADLDVVLSFMEQSVLENGKR